MEWIIQKAVELGAARIVPVQTARSVARASGRDDKKQARWQKIADEAAGQCGRGYCPQWKRPFPSGPCWTAWIENRKRERGCCCMKEAGNPCPGWWVGDGSRLPVYRAGGRLRTGGGGGADRAGRPRRHPGQAYSPVRDRALGGAGRRAGPDGQYGLSSIIPIRSNKILSESAGEKFRRDSQAIINEENAETQ